MKTTTKYMALASVAAVMLPAAMVSAATTNIEATANFLAAITLGGEVDMDFGTIEFSAAPAAGDTASLGTNGTVTYANNFTGDGSGTAGNVTITAATDGQTIDVFCDASATLTHSGGAGSGAIDAVSIEVVPEGSEGATGAGSACNGVGGALATSMVLDISGGTRNQFKFGGILDGSTAAAFTAGSYSTANGGGDDIQIDVFYQ